MNVRRRPRPTLLLADIVAVVALVASIAVIAVRLTGPSEASTGPAQPTNQAAAPETSDPLPPLPRTKLPPADDCRRKGITSGGTGEGTCFQESGRRIHVVNMTSVLRLPEMEARLLSITSKQRRVENAVDVDVRLQIRSKVKGTVDLSPERFGLHLGDRLFEPDPVVNGFAKGGLVSSGVRLRQGDSTSGRIIYRVPSALAAHLRRDGEVWIAQFSDFSPKSAGHTVGVIRADR